MSILAQSAPKAQVPAGASAPEFQASREGYKSLATLVGPGILPLKAGEVQPLFFPPGPHDRLPPCARGRHVAELPVRVPETGRHGLCHRSGLRV